MRHRDQNLVALGNEQARAGSLCGGNSGEAPDPPAGMFVDVEVTLAASCVDPSTASVVEEVVGVAGEIENLHG